MPVYNAASTLQKAVSSIQDQTLQDLEIILVDDGSSDGSVELGRSLAQKDPRIRFFPRPRQGLVQTLNFGLNRCRARYIARMDSDDISRPDRLRRQAEYLENNPDTGLVSGLVNYSGPVQKYFGYYLHVQWINSLLTPEQISLNRFIESPLAHPSVMFRRSLIDRFGPYRAGPFPEDYELWLRWLENRVKMSKIPEKVLDWKDHDQRLSRTDPAYAQDAFFRLKAGYLAAWLEKHNPFHPQVWVWGAGRRTRQRAGHILEHGCLISGYVDIRENAAGNLIHGRPVRHFLDLPGRDEAFIVVFVRTRHAREEIRSFLRSREHVEGCHFVMAA